MAGGTWTAQNKKRPGVYINYKSAPATLAKMGERGTVAIARILPWGGPSNFITIEDPADCMSLLGYDQTAPEMCYIRQILLGSNRTAGANKILVWGLATSGSAKAAVTVGNLTATAKFVGTRGNDLSIVITADPDNPENSDPGEYKVYVQTRLSGDVMDTQTLVHTDSMPTVSQLVNNAWVDFSGTGALAATVGASLTGGLDGTLSATAYSDFMTALEAKYFDVVIYDGTDAVVKAAFASFAKRLSNDEGKKVQVVMSDYAGDSECVVNVYPHTVTLSDGTTLTAQELTWWVGGATAGAKVNESLTNATYPDVVSINPLLTGSQQDGAISSGKFALIEQYGTYRVLEDINSLVTFTPDLGEVFSHQRPIRTVFSLCNSIYELYSKNYIGAVDNDDDGRSLLKAEILALLNDFASNRAVKNVDVDDVTVSPGQASNAVVIEVLVQLIDAVEKIYLQLTIS